MNLSCVGDWGVVSESPAPDSSRENGKLESWRASLVDILNACAQRFEVCRFYGFTADDNKFLFFF